MQYKLIEGFDGVCFTSDVGEPLFVPNDEGNADWAAYQKWIAADNSPEAADAPPRVIPQVVSPSQGGIVLIKAGLMDAVQAAVSDPTTPPEVKWAFDRATKWDRNSSALAYLAAKANISAQQMDDLFISASQIQA